MSTTPTKTKATKPEQSRLNPTVSKTQAREDAATETRGTLGIGPSGVYGADDGIILAEAIDEPTPDPDTEQAEG